MQTVAQQQRTQQAMSLLLTQHLSSGSSEVASLRHPRDAQCRQDSR
jgi:hypothetical protein